jgi:hypothetical protein
MFPHEPIILTSLISSGQCQVNKSIDQVAIVILFAQQYHSPEKYLCKMLAQVNLVKHLK